MNLRSRAVRWALHQQTILSVIHFALHQVPETAELCSMSIIVLDIDGILPKGPHPPGLRMADRALLAGYPRYRPKSHLKWPGDLYDGHSANLQYSPDPLRQQNAYGRRTHLIARCSICRYSVVYAEKLDLYISSHIAGDAPTTSEWSTVLSPTKVCLILQILLYAVMV